MRATIKTWGNSLAVRLPKAIAAEAGLAAEAAVELSVREGSIVLSPVKGRAARLRTLVSLMTAENIHGQDDFGDAVGRERL